ncbi:MULTISPECIES: hypothetical protein [Streptomyces]|nr:MULTISPECIES: hypothetical protein [Streptomyces]
MPPRRIAAAEDLIESDLQRCIRPVVVVYDAQALRTGSVGVATTNPSMP